MSHLKLKKKLALQALFMEFYDDQHLSLLSSHHPPPQKKKKKRYSSFALDAMAKNELQQTKLSELSHD